MAFLREAGKTETETRAFLANSLRQAAYDLEAGDIPTGMILMLWFRTAPTVSMMAAAPGANPMTMAGGLALLQGQLLDYIKTRDIS